MADRSHYTLVDFLYAVISPALIMALIISLVFFLIDVFYDGQYPGKVQWIFFFFIFGSVLVSRIAMSGFLHERAPIYGVVLAVASFLGLQLYVDYSETPLQGLGALVNLGLLGLAWWSAYQLTWDCTFMDDIGEQQMDQGLVDATKRDPQEAVEKSAAEKPKRKRRSADLEPSTLTLWLERFRNYRDERNRKRTPGTWVIYFSLAALPLFGLGQAKIPLDEAGRRQNAFWFMACYAASTLGLLLATQFLGLRRYLRERGVKMPAAIVARWLTWGAVVILVVLGVSALLPRPWPEYSLGDLVKAGSEERDAGRGQGKGKEGEQGQEQHDRSASKRGESGEGSAGSGGSGSGSASGGSQSGSEGSGSPSSESKGSRQASAGNKSSTTNPSNAPKPPRVAQPTWLQSFGPLGTILKWVVIVVVVLVVLFVVLKSGLSFLANFTNWAARLLAALSAWWKRLFAIKVRARESVAPGTLEAAQSIRPFKLFVNPFLSRSAADMSADELVQYTFDAVESWAAERVSARRVDETPLEFVSRLGEEMPDFHEALDSLAALYGHMAYARQRLPESARSAMESLWKQLDSQQQLQPLRESA